MLGSRDVLAFFPQVSGVKQEESCLYLAPLEQMDFRVPQVSKGPKVLFKFYFTWRWNWNILRFFSC